MRVGFDIDGVLADFCTAYEDLIIGISGEDYFPLWAASEGPATWNWPEHHGYDPSVIKEAWRQIKASETFWQDLRPTTDFRMFSRWYRDTDHEVYFVTARPGLQVKNQTEEWFWEHGVRGATVLISDQKGAVCNALGLDYYVDDKGENVESVELLSPSTNAFLIDRTYNRHAQVKNRVFGLAPFLERIR